MPPQQKSPVLLLIFNRADTTLKVFEAIRQAEPNKLYISSDGARDIEEAQIVKALRSKISSTVDWPCEIHTLYREKNLGCRDAVKGAIDWFFEHEEQGIILEDDCLPHPNFFSYCEHHLKQHGESSDIATIAGTRMKSSRKQPSCSGELSQFFACWGWATWRASWQQLSTHDYNAFASQSLAKMHPELQRYYNELMAHCRNNSNSSWAYEISLVSLQLGLLHIIPPANLILNLGFTKQSTHSIRKPPNAPTNWGSIRRLQLQKELNQPDQESELAFVRTQFQPFYRRWFNRILYSLRQAHES